MFDVYLIIYFLGAPLATGVLTHQLATNATSVVGGFNAALAWLACVYLAISVAVVLAVLLVAFGARGVSLPLLVELGRALATMWACSYPAFAPTPHLRGFALICFIAALIAGTFHIATMACHGLYVNCLAN